jgi:hypothetical protein
MSLIIRRDATNGTGSVLAEATVTDWSRYNACKGCPAARAEPCYRLTSGGPEALPPVFADKPHPGRPLTAAAKPPATSTPAKRGPRTARNPTARRSASRTDTTVAAWQALAAKQKGSR